MMYGRRPLSRAASPTPLGFQPTPIPTYGAPVASTPYHGGHMDPALINAMGAMSMMGGPPTTMPSTVGQMPGPRPTSQADFKVEKVARPPSSMGVRYSPTATTNPELYFDENVYRAKAAAVVQAKERAAFAATGYVFADPAQMNLFFRGKSGITQSIDFPVDVEYNPPPAWDVLVAACRPHQASEYGSYSADRESLFYPPSLPLTTSFEFANFSILDSVRSTLFPNLPQGHYLTAVKDKLELLMDGSKMDRQGAHLRNDGRAATVLLTLPVRFAGGDVLIRDGISGQLERFTNKIYAPASASSFMAHNHQGKEAMEWVAFLASSDYETERVEKGYRVMMSYGVYIKSYSPDGATTFESASIPTDRFFDLLAPVMNMSRGKKIAFYLTHDYAINPSASRAEALVPQLKGSDYHLYHAFKMYKLVPELHWAAGEYIWPFDRLVEFFSEDISSSPNMPSSAISAHTPRMPQPYGRPPSRGASLPSVGYYGGAMPGSSPPSQYPPYQHHHHGGPPTVPVPYPGAEQTPLRSRVEESGGQLFVDAGVTVLTDWNNPAAVHGAVERVPFIARGELQKFVVNVLLVAYVP